MPAIRQQQVEVGSLNVADSPGKQASTHPALQTCVDGTRAASSTASQQTCSRS